MWECNLHRRERRGKRQCEEVKQEETGLFSHSRDFLSVRQSFVSEECTTLQGIQMTLASLLLQQ